MIENQNNKDNFTEEVLNDEFDEFLAEFGVHKAQSFRFCFNHKNLVRAVANNLTSQLINQLTDDNRVLGNETFSVGDEANRILDKYGINHASDSTFITTNLALNIIGDDIRLARSYFNAPNARLEISRIANRFNNEDWQAWLRQTASESAEAICLDLSSISLQIQRDCISFTVDEMRQLLANLASRQDECAERQTRLEEQQQNNRREQSSQTINNQTDEEPVNLFGRMKQRANGLFDLNRYFPGQNDESRNQSQVSEEADPLESFLAKAEFESAATQTESAFYNELLEILVDRLRILEDSLNITRKRISEILSCNAKIESKRGFGLAGGEMLLNSSELTRATIKFLAPDDLRKEILLFELREKIDSIVENREGNLRDSDIDQISDVITEVVEEKLSDFYVADAIAALLHFQPNFETQLHNAIHQTVATDFLSSGWYQFLTPKLNYFAALSYLQSIFEETNETLNEVIRRIAASLNLNYEMKNEAFNSNREEFCFYIEYFCLPVESFEFYEKNITDFEKVKDLPSFNPRFDLYE